MRKIFGLLCLFTCLSFSQNKQVLYGFSEIPQSLMLNPGGKIKNNGYVGMPLLSHIHVNVGMSGMSVYDLFAKDGISFTEKLEKAVYSMTNSDFFTVNQQLEVFSGGYAFGDKYNKNEYLSFGLYQELDFITYFPKDYAVLALEGNQNNIGRFFNAGDVNLKAELISVLHVGYNKILDDNFTFGIRGKIYSSVFNVNSVRNQGAFVTVPGVNNSYKHFFNLDLELETSGLASLLNDDNSDASEDVSTLRNRFLFGGNLGLGLDLGFTFKLNEQLSLDASLLDIGFVSHTKDVESYKIKGELEFEGIDPIFSLTQTGQSAQENWSEIEDEFTELFEVDTVRTKYTTWRPLKFNASINYGFGKKDGKQCNCTVNESDFLNRIGLQVYGIKRPKYPQLALTAYYYRRIFNSLRVKGTYTIDSFSNSNIGFGLSTHLGPVNFYVMADDLLAYRNNIYDAKSASLQLGFNYIFKNR